MTHPTQIFMHRGIPVAVVDDVAIEPHGAFCAALDQTNLDDLAESLRPVFLRALPLAANRRAIFVHRTLWDIYTSGQRKAMLDHEVGHAVLGHVGCESGSDRFHMQEIQADSYSIHGCGNSKEDMFGAIQVAIEHFINYQITGMKALGAVSHIVQSVTIIRENFERLHAPRLKILRAA